MMTLSVASMGVLISCGIALYAFADWDSRQPLSPFVVGILAWLCLPYAVSILLSLIRFLTAKRCFRVALKWSTLVATGAEVGLRVKMLLFPAGSTDAVAVFTLPLAYLMIFCAAFGFIYLSCRVGGREASGSADVESHREEA